MIYLSFSSRCKYYSHAKKVRPQYRLDITTKPALNCPQTVRVFKNPKGQGTQLCLQSPYHGLAREMGPVSG